MTANAEVEKMMGIPPGSFDGRFDTWAAFVVPEDHRAVESAWREAMDANRTEMQYEFRIPRHDGEIRWITARAKIFYDEVGEPDMAVGVNIDITDRKKWEQSLEESEKRYRLLAEANPIGVVFGGIAGPRYGELTAVNDAFLSIIGYSREEIDSGAVAWTDITPPEYLSQEQAAISEAIRSGGKSRPYEKEYIRKDGTRIPVLVAFAVVGETQEDAVAFVVDISDRKRVEEELRQRTEELARSNDDLQRFAYAASHDLQEPLRTISAYSQLFERRVGHLSR